MAIYIGVNGKARKVVGGYIGINGKAEIIYNGGSNLPTGYVPYTYIYKTGKYEIDGINTPSGYYLNTYTQVICDFKIGATSVSSSYSPCETIFYINDSYKAYIYKTNDSHKYRVSIFKGNDYWGSEELDSGTECNINMTKNDNGDCYFNNTKIFTNIQALGSISTIYPMYTNEAYYGMVKLKGLSFYDLINKKELIHLEPCNDVRDGSKIKSGLYNSIDKTFYTNSNYYHYFVCSNS